MKLSLFYIIYPVSEGLDVREMKTVHYYKCCKGLTWSLMALPTLYSFSASLLTPEKGTQGRKQSVIQG